MHKHKSNENIKTGKYNNHNKNALDNGHNWGKLSLKVKVGNVNKRENFLKRWRKLTALEAKRKVLKGQYL